MVLCDDAVDETGDLAPGADVARSPSSAWSKRDVCKDAEETGDLAPMADATSASACGGCGTCLLLVLNPTAGPRSATLWW